MAYDKACADSSSPLCVTLSNAINANACDTIARANFATTTADASQNKEYVVGASDDNQAYTCVKIFLNTDDFTGSVKENDSDIVHLRSESSFNKVKITWFSQEDSGSANPNVQTYNSIPPQLPSAKSGSWTSVMPPILRAQYIPVDGTNNDDLDSAAKTVFLYPRMGAAPTEFALNDDHRRSGGFPAPAPHTSRCNPTYDVTGGVCSTTVVLPAVTSNAYLQLSALYNSTSYKVELIGATGPVKFNGVAPMVDSTGRAADLFRRVDARIELGGAPLPAPIAGLFTTGNLCKGFTLQDTYGNPYESGPCNP